MNSRPRKMISEIFNYPWFDYIFFYDRNMLGLDKEIKHFCDYMAPTQVERCIRRDLSQRIEHIIVSIWPDAQVHLYGSFRTRLYLSTSDINITVVGKWECLPFDILKQEFIDKGLADKDNIKMVGGSTIPRLKLTDKKTQLDVDISFNNYDGIKSAELVERYIREYPTLPKLIYVVKQFLIVRDLHGTEIGGISSYILTLMCISLLQLHFPPPEDIRNANLGVLLMEFFELYGKTFNYKQIAIRIKNGGSYVDKKKLQIKIRDDSKRSLLFIEDPILPTNDVGKRFNRITNAKRAFEGSFQTLTKEMNPLNMYDLSMRRSILGRIIFIPHKTETDRHWVAEQFSQLLNSPPGSLSLQLSETAGISKSPLSHFNGDFTSNADNTATLEGVNRPSRSNSANNVC